MRRLATAALALLLCAPAALAHEGNPNFLSEIEGTRPALDGVRLEMLNRDDRLLLENRSAQDVVILGYEEEPYARVKADGTVEVNTNSRAYYLNEDRFGTNAPETLPKDPEWKKLSGSGRFEWHDHRAHYMGKGTPPQVKDPDVRQKVFDWEVPVRAGSTAAVITGTLFWTPQESSGVPTGAIVVGAGIVILLSVAVIVVRRRRAAAPERGEPTEAW